MAVQAMSDDKSVTWETGSGHTLRVGDFVYLIPKDPSVDLYIAKIDKMYRDEKGKRWIQTRWYYRPGDLRHEPPSKPLRNEVYYTNYFDCNEVESVARHCKVFTKSEYFDERRRSSTEMSYEDIYFYEYCYSDETGSFAKFSVSDPHIRHGFRKKTVTPDRPKDVSLKVLIDALVDLEETLPRDSLTACLKEKRLDWLTRVKESKTVNNITQWLLVFEDFLRLNTNGDGKNECNYLSEWRKALTANSSPESILQNIQHLKVYVLLRHGSTPKKRKRSSSETINTSDQGRDKLPLLQEVASDELANESDKIGAAIKEGGIYEINYKSLPPKSPIHLKSIRAVLVTEKTKVNVSVRFPSNLALRKYFGKEFCEGAAKNVSQSPQARQLTRIGSHPELDEQFVMGPRMAARVLVRQIHPTEYVHQRHLESFWLINSKQSVTAAADEAPRTQVKVPEPASMSADKTRPADVGKGATLTSEVEVENVPITWGLRRKVSFNRKHRSWTEKEDEETFTENDSPEIRGRPGQKRQRQTADDADVAFRFTGEKSSILKLPKEMQGRWTSERYRTAQLKLLDIMHEKGALPGRPILRPALREEARKHIGDTGLLDHLLKHMTDTVVTNGERFRRRHNADGAMEYWLEEAGLMEIRKQAGIEDPSWIPPPGWKPGDKLHLNGYGAGMTPLEAEEMKALKEDIIKLKSELVSLKNINVTPTKRNDPAEHGGISKEKLKDIEIEITSLRKELQNKSLEITSLRKELSELQNKSLGDNNQMLLPKTEPLNKETKQTNQSESQDEKPIQACASMSRCNILGRIEKLETEKNNFVQEMESKYSAEKQHLENQFAKLSETVERIQEEMNAITKFVAESKDSSLAATQNAIKEPSPEQSRTNPSELSMNMPSSTEENVENGEPSRMKSENTACKGQQRPARTGFRVCKPEGTFIWPNAAPKMCGITISSTSSRLLSHDPEYLSLEATDKDVNASSSTVNKDISVSAGISSAVAVYKSLSEAEMCPCPAKETFTTQLSLSPDSRSGQKRLLQPSPCGRQKELISMYATHLTTPRVPWAQASGQIALARPPLTTNHILPPVLPQLRPAQGGHCHVRVLQASGTSDPQSSWLGLAPPASSSAPHDTKRSVTENFGTSPSRDCSLY